jgi:hypothetical protein
MMRITRSVALALVLCLLFSSAVFAAGGSQDDPVISYSYLTTTLYDSLIADANALADAGKNAYTGEAFTAFSRKAGELNLQNARANTDSVYVQGRILLKAGDILTLAPGAQATLLAGRASSDSSNLVDITDGVKLDGGRALALDHRYMKNDREQGGLQIDSETAEVYVDGVVSLAYSSSTDYASLADALHSMGLFSGMTGATTGYGLEKSCTRIEALIMFLRLIGVEEQAAAYTGTHPFKDVPAGHWAYRYLAYAYSQGLAYGTSTTAFSPSKNVTAQEYLTFLMRCLHYKEGTDFSYKTVLNDVTTLGVFSSREIQFINSGSFLRNRMVYLSYYTLFGTEQNSGKLLLLSLVDAGAVPESAAVAGAARIIGVRIS